MDRRSWPWRKKSNSIGSKIPPKAFFTHNASFSSEIAPTTQKVATSESARHLQSLDLLVEDRVPDAEYLRLLEAVAVKEKSEEKVKNLTEELDAALAKLRNKETVIKQQCKTSEDAVAGWEKAENEAKSLQQKLELSVGKANMAETRVVQLEVALKECMKQVRQAREEQQQKIKETIEIKTREYNSMKSEMQTREAELKQCLMESDAQNNVMAKTLQERAMTIVELREAKGKVETDVKLMQVKIESMEKEISAFKYEVHVLNKELDLRNEERNAIKKAADATHKQHLEDVRKIAQIESDCQRLRMLVKKKLPGPAAIAQMKAEVDSNGIVKKTTNDQTRRRRASVDNSNGIGGLTPFPNLEHRSSAQSLVLEKCEYSKDMEIMADRLLAMEEENKVLKETLAKRIAELHSTRHKIGDKPFHDERHSDSCQGTPTNMTPRHLQKKSQSVESISVFSDKLQDDDTTSSAESWASALITELDHFKKNEERSKMSSDSRRTLEQEKHQSVETSTASSPVPAAGEKGVKQKHRPEDLQTLRYIASKESQLQSANLMCKDAILKFSSAEEKLVAKLTLEDPDIEQSMKNISEGRGLMLKLDRILDEMRIAVASVGDMTDDEEDSHPNSNPTLETCNCHDNTKATSDTGTALQSDSLIKISFDESFSLAGFSFVLCKLISLLESLANSSDKGEMVMSQLPKHFQALKAAKDTFLRGRGSVVEFFLRIVIFLSCLCNSETADLDNLLSKELTTKTSVGHDGKSETSLEIENSITEQLNTMIKELDEARDKIKALEADLQMAEDKLIHSGEANREELEKIVAENETKKADLQERLNKTENEVSKLQKTVATLTVELADKRKEYDAVVAKCQALDLKLQGFVNNEDKSGEHEDPRGRKEREMMDAKIKLAECQRTICMLGKQLTAIGGKEGSGTTEMDHRDSSISYKSDQRSIDRESGSYAVQQQKRDLTKVTTAGHQYGSVGGDSGAHGGGAYINNYNMEYSISRPRRIHSDIAHMRSSAVYQYNRNIPQQYSVADYLLMQEEPDEGSNQWEDPNLNSNPNANPNPNGLDRSTVLTPTKSGLGSRIFSSRRSKK